MMRAMEELADPKKGRLLAWVVAEGHDPFPGESEAGLSQIAKGIAGDGPALEEVRKTPSRRSRDGRRVRGGGGGSGPAGARRTGAGRLPTLVAGVGLWGHKTRDCGRRGRTSVELD